MQATALCAVVRFVGVPTTFHDPCVLSVCLEKLGIDVTRKYLVHGFTLKTNMRNTEHPSTGPRFIQIHLIQMWGTGHTPFAWEWSPCPPLSQAEIIVRSAKNDQTRATHFMHAMLARIQWKCVPASINQRMKHQFESPAILCTSMYCKCCFINAGNSSDGLMQVGTCWEVTENIVDRINKLTTSSNYMKAIRYKPLSTADISLYIYTAVFVVSFFVINWWSSYLVVICVNLSSEGNGRWFLLALGTMAR